MSALMPDLDDFHASGFVVLRRAFDPRPLLTEMERALGDGLVASPGAARAGGIRFQYVPMMSAETPVSSSLLDQLEPVAARLLGGPVLPTRAKGVLYRGDTPWHADSASPIASVGCAAYLQPLRAETGALRVIPGSHRHALGPALQALVAAGAPAEALPAHAVETDPGDVIVFDEHLFHASAGGGARHQWRLDFLRDPVGAEAEAHARAYFQGIYPPDWDGGYDVDRHASYGPDWLGSGRSSVARLGELGVYDLAAEQEARTRRRRAG